MEFGCPLKPENAVSQQYATMFGKYKFSDLIGYYQDEVICIRAKNVWIESFEVIQVKNDENHLYSLLFNIDYIKLENYTIIKDKKFLNTGTDIFEKLDIDNFSQNLVCIK
jgi:hypothetical protein